MSLGAFRYVECHSSDAERNAADIRIRAERRVGQMLAELQRATPQERAESGGIAKSALSNDWTKQEAIKSEYATTLEQVGISRQTANRYESLARLPDPSFEAGAIGADLTNGTSNDRICREKSEYAATEGYSARTWSNDTRRKEIVQ